MKMKNKIIGALTLSALALAVFTAVPNVSAANNSASLVCQGMGLNMGRMQGGMRDSLAGFLGMDASKLMESRHSGKSMVQIANEQGKSQDELYNFMFSQCKARIDQMVASGQISAETAAAHEAVMQERIRQNMNRTEVGPNCAGNNQTKGMGLGKHKGNGQGCRFNQ
jgi:hypothetical protein